MKASQYPQVEWWSQGDGAYRRRSEDVEEREPGDGLRRGKMEMASRGLDGGIWRRPVDDEREMEEEAMGAGGPGIVRV